jgi:hypothetical protein
MKRLQTTSLARAAVILAVALVSPTLLGQQPLRFQDAQGAVQQAQQQQKLEQILSDRAGYVAAIVQRWEDSARASGRWDESYSVDLQQALMSLQPENLLAAGEAPSYETMMTVLKTGRTDATLQTRAPLQLGQVGADQVYTAVTPCRIIDTRLAVLGALNGVRSFDVDGSNFTAQGGSATGCGIPFGVASAVAMTITVTGSVSPGFIVAWSVTTAQPLSSVLNYNAAQTIANTTIIPVAPGAGDDFNLFSFSNTHVIVDVAGYYAAPVATALDCISVASAVTAMPVNVWTNLDVTCPAGRTATGGGYFTTEGNGGYPGVWTLTMPAGNGWRTWVDNQTIGTRTIQTWCNCCRVPGR